MNHSNNSPSTGATIFRLSGILVLLTALATLMYSCKEKGCAYDGSIPPQGCILVDSLNLSTGIDANGNVLAPGFGVVDPFWKLINKPPLGTCAPGLTSTINGSAYVINYNNNGNTGWVNQPGSSTLAPVDLGTTLLFGCNNPVNANGASVPYVFERPFCVLSNTNVDFSFTVKGDDTVYFELVDNATGAVLSSSLLYSYPAAPLTWSATALPLTAGSYSIRGYLSNLVNVVLGFSMAGHIGTTNGDLAISNNVEGCCENNTISILNVLEEVCNGVFDGGDQVGAGWTFNLLDASNNVINMGTTDINGNLFFAGLPDGTYTVSVVPQAGWTTNSPAGGSATVTLANNGVAIIEFYSCQ